jgi:hypothetical protein
MQDILHNRNKKVIYSRRGSSIVDKYNKQKRPIAFFGNFNLLSTIEQFYLLRTIEQFYLLRTID